MKSSLSNRKYLRLVAQLHNHSVTPPIHLPTRCYSATNIFVARGSPLRRVGSSSSDININMSGLFDDKDNAPVPNLFGLDALASIERNLKGGSKAKLAEINEYNDPVLLEKYDMKVRRIPPTSLKLSSRDTDHEYSHLSPLRMGRFPDYRQFFDPDSPLSPYWPQPLDKSDDSYTREFGLAMLAASKEADSDPVADGDVIYSAASEQELREQLDTYARTGNVIAQRVSFYKHLTFDQLQNSQPPAPVRYSYEPGSYCHLDMVTERHVLSLTLANCFNNMKTRMAHVEAERLLFIMELIRHDEVPNWYILRHLHEIIKFGPVISSQMIAGFMREALAYSRLGLVFSFMSLHNHGLTHTGRTNMQMINYAIQAAVLYLDLPSFARLKPNVVDGFITDLDKLRDSMIDLLHDVKLASLHRVKGAERADRNTPNATFFTLSMTLFGAFQLPKLGLEWFRRAPAYDVERDIAVWNSTMRMLLTCKEHGQAMALFTEMTEKGLKPDVHTAKLLLTLFVEHDPSALGAFVDSQRSRNALQTSFMNLMLSRLFLNRQPKVYVHDVNHAGTEFYVDTSDNLPPTSVPLLDSTYVPLYHSAAIKFAYQAECIYQNLVEQFPSLASIPFRGADGSLFMSHFPEEAFSQFTDEEKYVLWAFKTSDVFLRSSSPKQVDTSFRRAETLMEVSAHNQTIARLRESSNYYNASANSGNHESTRWADEAVTDQFKQSAMRDVIVDPNPFIDTSTPQYVINQILPFTTPLPNPRLAPGPYLYSHLVDPTSPVTEEELQAFQYCSQLTDFPHELLADPNTPPAVCQAYDMFQLMPQVNCLPDLITYSTMMAILDGHNMHNEVIRILNRCRLSLTCDTPFSFYLVAYALYKEGRLRDASLISQRLNVSVSHGPSLMRLCSDAHKANDVDALISMCNKVLHSVLSPNCAPVVYVPRMFYNIVNYTISALSRSTYKGKAEYILETIRFIYNYTGFFSENDLDPRSKTRMLLVAIKAAQVIRRGDIENFLRQLIATIDPEFIDVAQKGRGTSITWVHEETNNTTVDVSLFAQLNDDKAISDLAAAAQQEQAQGKVVNTSNFLKEKMTIRDARMAVSKGSVTAPTSFKKTPPNQAKRTIKPPTSQKQSTPTPAVTDKPPSARSTPSKPNLRSSFKAKS